MKVKLECPINFLKVSELETILATRRMCLSDKNPDIVIVNPGTDKFLDASYFSKYKNLKVVGTPSTGTNHIDVAGLREKEISVVCLLDDKESLQNIHASAEFTWIHVMNLMRKFSKAIGSVDEWRSDKNELSLRSNELFGKIIGIVGMGRIGSKIAKYAKAFGMSVRYYDPYVKKSDAIRVRNLSDLTQCDVITINCVLNQETENLISDGVWDNIKPKTIVVNTSRGEVVNEAYIKTLIEKRGIIYGADVLQGEQDLERLKNSPLYLLSKVTDRVIITPHVAGATKESQTKALVYTLDLVKELA